VYGIRQNTVAVPAGT